MDTFVTSFEEIGRAEGRAEGQREVVLRLLSRKLGAVPATVEAQIVALAPAQLLLLSEALLDFTTPDDLAAWLNAQEHG